MKYGIYSITNVCNKKRYIGSSKDIHVREKQHINLLRKNKHHCRKLQYDFNYYGESNFKFECLSELESDAELAVMEQYFISLTPTSELYNSQKIVRRKDSHLFKKKYLNKMTTDYLTKNCLQLYDILLLISLCTLLMYNVILVLPLIPQGIKCIKHGVSYHKFNKMHKNLLRI